MPITTVSFHKNNKKSPYPNEQEKKNYERHNRAPVRLHCGIPVLRRAHMMMMMMMMRQAEIERRLAHHAQEHVIASELSWAQFGSELPPLFRIVTASIETVSYHTV